MCLEARPLNSLLSDVWICYFLTSHLNETYSPLKGKKLVTLIGLKVPARIVTQKHPPVENRDGFFFFSLLGPLVRLHGEADQ